MRYSITRHHRAPTFRALSTLWIAIVHVFRGRAGRHRSDQAEGTVWFRAVQRLLTTTTVLVSDSLLIKPECVDITNTHEIFDIRHRLASFQPLFPLPRYLFLPRLRKCFSHISLYLHHFIKHTPNLQEALVVESKSIRRMTTSASKTMTSFERRRLCTTRRNARQRRCDAEPCEHVWLCPCWCHAVSTSGRA